MGDTVIKRRHTANAKRDLPGIVAEAITTRDFNLKEWRTFCEKG
ncbi:MAG: hypothetical protein ABJH99_14015 [Tateyamaria sp.]